MVEYLPSKQNVAGSSPVFRSVSCDTNFMHLLTYTILCGILDVTGKTGTTFDNNIVKKNCLFSSAERASACGAESQEFDSLKRHNAIIKIHARILKNAGLLIDKVWEN